MERLTLRAGSKELREGPRDLSSTELQRFGLGVVVRHLRVAGVPMASPLSRVYCLSCGVALDHEAGGAEWWFCRNACSMRKGR